MLKKLLRWITVIGLIFILIFVLAWGLLQLPSVQTEVVRLVTEQLSNTLNAKVSVDKVDIDFFKTLSLEGIYIEDRQQDTLLAAGSLKVNIGVMSLLNKKISLTEITVNEAFLNIYQQATDTVANYTFLLDAFAADPNADTSTTTTPWTFGVDAIYLNKTRVHFNDEVAGMHLKLLAGTLGLTIDLLDLDNQRIDFNQLSIDQTDLTFLTNPADAKMIDSTIQAPIPFPYTGWDFRLNDFNVQSSNIKYALTTASSIAPGINFNNLKVEDLTVDMQNLQWTDTLILAEVKQVKMTEQSGFQLDQLAGDLRFSPNGISVNNLIIETPNSTINIQTSLKYTSFADLTRFDENVNYQITFNNTKIGVRDMELLAPVLDTIMLINLEALRTVRLDGSISGNVLRTNFSNMLLKIDEVFTLRLGGQLTNLLDPDNLGFNITLKELTTSYNQLKKITKGLDLPPALATFGQFKLSGSANGTLSDFTADQLALSTETTTGFELSGHIKNATNIDQFFADIDINNLTTRAADLTGFVEGGLPPAVDSLGFISYTGKFSGNTTDFKLVGVLNTDIGKLESDLAANFNADYSDATYNGDLKLDKFELNKILGDSVGVGMVSLNAKIDGSGIRPENIKVQIDGNVEQVRYQNYDYKNLIIAGKIDRQEFRGDFKITDPNITFDFTGLIDLNSEIPDFQFTMDLDTIDFAALNLLDRTLKLSGYLDVNLQGNDINNLAGTANITDFIIRDSAGFYYSDSILLEAGLAEDGLNQATLKSPFLAAEVKGKYNFSELPTMVIAYINDYFPLDDILSPEQLAIRFEDIKNPQLIDWRLELLDTKPIQLLVLPDLQYAEKISMSGTFDSQKRNMTINANGRKIVYGKNRLKTIKWEALGNNQKFTNGLTLEELEIGANLFPKITLKNRLFNDSAYIELIVNGQDTIDQLLQFSANIDRPDDAYVLRFNEDFTLSDKTWKIPSDNYLRYGKEQLEVNNLTLQDGQHSLSINTVEENSTSLIPPVLIDFDQFQISEIMALVLPGNDLLSGKINGQVKIMDPLDNLHFTVDLKVPDMAMNKSPIGSLTVDLGQAPGESVIKVNARLNGEINDMKVTGDYDIEAGRFDIAADIRQLEMRLLDLVLVDIIEKSTGTFSGGFTLKGTPDKPDLTGQIQVQDIGTKVVFTQLRYTLEKGTIDISNKTIDLGVMALQDSLGNTAFLTGKINHRFFDKMTLEMELSTDQFSILNTTAADNPLFYGNLLLAATVDISGPIELPVMEINAKTLESSVVNLSPFAETEVALEEDFIIFGNPDTYVQTTDSVDFYEAKAVLPFDVRLNLELTDNALLRIIVDPVTGDRLKCKGNSDMVMNFLPSGAMEMFGTYTISSGEYQFSYGELVKKKFDIVPGGTVFFNGDPLNSRFNVSAKYTTQATPYELIASEATLSSGEIKQAQKRQDVSVVMSLKGNLAEPILTFDIALPEAEGTIVSSAIQRKLVELRNNPSELNKQVFGLLLINSFIISSSSTSTNFASAGENIVLSSVSKLFSNQLNSLADKFVKGVEINFDLNSYQSEYANDGAGGNVTEVGIGITKQLFNDRLSLTAGGSFDINSGGGTGSTQVAGDFLLTYELTKSGSYLLKVFRRSDFDVLNEENSVRTGVGVSFKKQFDKKKDKN